MGSAKQEDRKGQETAGRPAERTGSPAWLYVVAGVVIAAVAILAALLLTHTQR